MPDEPRMEDAPPWKPTGFAETRAARTCSLIIFALVMLYTFVAFYPTASSIPRFESMFMEMNAELPGLTRFFLSIAPVLWPLVLLAAIGGAVKEFVVRDRSITLIINGVHLVVLVAIKELIVVALGAPLICLMETLGGA
jgi:hypothetical protein